MTDRNPIPPKTVIVLGAGASAADGAPLQADLFREYFQGAAKDRVDGQMQAALTQYFRQLWGIDVTADVSAAKFPTFEEALGILDTAESRGESFRGAECDPHITAMGEMRYYLASLIAVILDEKLRQLQANHGNLLNNLRRVGWLANCVFLSLNYDIIIDNAIEDCGHAQRRQAVPDYAVEFVTAPHSDGEPFPKANLLLKVHGSLNWLHCPCCNTLDLFSHRKIAAEFAMGLQGLHCPRCRGSRAAIIVPPTFFKVMSNFYLQQIWKRAEEELRQAGRIVFCGYSFPDADIHIKYLLKRAEVNRTGSPPAVFIVNRPADRSIEEHRDNDERNRYERFFREKDQVHWTNLSFQDFAADPQAIEDQTRWQ